MLLLLLLLRLPPLLLCLLLLLLLLLSPAEELIHLNVNFFLFPHLSFFLLLKLDRKATTTTRYSTIANDNHFRQQHLRAKIHLE